MTFKAPITALVACNFHRREMFTYWLNATKVEGKPNTFWAQEIEDLNDAMIELQKVQSQARA
jgi:hypothetical protein